MKTNKITKTVEGKNNLLFLPSQNNHPQSISPRLVMFWTIIALLFVAAGTTRAQGIVSGNIYKLRNQCSDKLLDVSGISLADGASVHQWRDVNGSNQKWKIEAVDSGYYRLLAQHSQKALDANDGGTADGTTVIQWSLHNNTNQQWKITAVGDGFYRLEARHASGKMLDVSGASTANGAKVQLWTNNNTCAQKWRLEPDVQYSGAIVINSGGTYSGNWESQNPAVPAVKIETSEPVIIENCNIRSKSDAISGWWLNLTVRNCRIKGLNPNIAGRSPGRFLTGQEVKNIRIENNYFESTKGIYIRDFNGDPAIGQTIKIFRNSVKNIDGRKSDGNNGFSQTEFDWSQFVQFDDVTNVPNVEIAWNQVINEPYNSRVEDNVSFYKSSGAPGNPFRVYDNYIQGGYTGRPEVDGYSGGGILLGDEHGSLAEAYNNQVVSTSNYGISISGGHDNKVYNNRIVSSGLLPNGIYIAAQNVGTYVWDYSRSRNLGLWYNNASYNNTVGWERTDGYGYYWFPDCDAGACTGNISLPGPITRVTEANEYQLWQQKLANNNVKIGPQN